MHQSKLLSHCQSCSRVWNYLNASSWLGSCIFCRWFVCSFFEKFGNSFQSVEKFKAKWKDRTFFLKKNRLINSSAEKKKTTHWRLPSEFWTCCPMFFFLFFFFRAIDNTKQKLYQQKWCTSIVVRSIRLLLVFCMFFFSNVSFCSNPHFLSVCFSCELLLLLLFGTHSKNRAVHLFLLSLEFSPVICLMWVKYYCVLILFSLLSNEFCSHFFFLSLSSLVSTILSYWLSHCCRLISFQFVFPIFSSRSFSLFLSCDFVYCTICYGGFCPNLKIFIHIVTYVLHHTLLF